MSGDVPRGLRKLVCDTTRTAGNKHFGMRGGVGDVMADDKMWQLLLYLASRWRHRWASVEAHFCNAWQL